MVTCIAWTGVLACGWWSLVLFVLAPRALGPANEPFAGSATLLVGLFGVAVTVAGAFIARGAILLRAAPARGRGPRVAFGWIALGGAITALPALRWLSLTTMHAVSPEDVLAWSDLHDAPVLTTLWLEAACWAWLLGVAAIGLPGWWLHRAWSGDRDAEVPVRHRARNAPWWVGAIWALGAVTLGVWGSPGIAERSRSMLRPYSAGGDWQRAPSRVLFGVGVGLPPLSEAERLQAAHRVLRGSVSPLGRWLTHHPARTARVATGLGRFFGTERWTATVERRGFPVWFADADATAAIWELPDAPEVVVVMPELLRLFEFGTPDELDAAAQALAEHGHRSGDVAPFYRRLVLERLETEREVQGVPPDPIDFWWEGQIYTGEEYLDAPALLHAIRGLRRLVVHEARDDARRTAAALLQHESRWLRAAMAQELVLQTKTYDGAPGAGRARFVLELLQDAVEDSDPTIADAAREGIAFLKTFGPPDVRDDEEK